MVFQGCLLYNLGIHQSVWELGPHTERLEEDLVSDSFEPDNSPTDEEAGNAFHTFVKWLEHHGYPDES